MPRGERVWLGKRNTRRSGAVVGVSGFLLGMLFLLGPVATSVHGKILLPPLRFTFKIEPQTPIEVLLPASPDVSVPLSPWLVPQWTEVPEILFQKPLAIKKTEPLQSATAEALKAQEEAMEKTALTIARINHLNQKGADHFLKVLLERRTDLKGLPVVMGDACRQSKERGQTFLQEVTLVRAAMQRREAVRGDFWEQYQKTRDELPLKEERGVRADQVQDRVAALMQILAPEDSGVRLRLVHYLVGIEHKEATRALARLAIFSFEEDVRRAAREALRKRSAEDWGDLLLIGLRYPWPAVAANAGEAIVHLGRRDLVAQLVAALDEPDPRAPAEREVNGRKTLAVRELVRINHHRNCLLCHAPGNTPDVELNRIGRSTKVVTGATPSPGQPFPPPSQGYDPSASPDVLVRADVTYLRQDFSLLMPVKDAAPWPERQRFDFLVRTRPVTTQDAAAYQQWTKQQGPGYLPPHKRAALSALRALTGRDAPEATAKAWRAVLEK